MEKKFVIVPVLVLALAFGVMASEKMTRNNFCKGECDNNICAGLENKTAIPNEASCTDFFLCIDEHPVPNTCPPGQWFDPIECICSNDTKLDCDPSNGIECPKDGIHFFPHEEYCDKYFMCFAGTPVKRHCADGLYFDRRLGTCNLPELAECPLEICPPFNDHENIVFIPSLRDCEKFFICYNGEPLEFRCAPGIHWNAELEMCDFPENANCTVPTTPPPEEESPFPEETECSPEGIYFLPHPNSCEHYFICCKGDSFLFQCANGFYFDPIRDWCDAPRNVECSANGGGNSTTAATPKPETPKPDSGSDVPDVELPDNSAAPDPDTSVTLPTRPFSKTETRENLELIESLLSKRPAQVKRMFAQP